MANFEDAKNTKKKIRKNGKMAHSKQNSDNILVFINHIQP